jgi:hypothetical protein
VPANGTGDPGQQVFVGYGEGRGTSQLEIRRGQVYCNVNPDTAKRPVTIDTAIEALLTGPGACVEVLADDDSLWNRSQCEGDGYDSGGCGLAPASFAAAELTSAALFAVLLARRWRRARR